MDVNQVLERFEGEPFDAALRRLTRRLVVDEKTLRLLRRAAEVGDARQVAAYGWAVGVAPAEVRGANPARSGEAYKEAALMDPDDPAIAFAYGLANTGSFSRRRGLPLSARRGFAAAARLDSANALPHLALAAARFASGDDGGAEHAIGDALSATVYRTYPSPLADELLAAAPWMGQSLAVLWPDRTAAAVRFALTSLTRQADSARRRRAEPSLPLVHLLRLARLMIDTGPARPIEFLQAAGAASLGLTARVDLLGDQAAAQARDEVARRVDQLLHDRRALAARFERKARGQLDLSALGVVAGVGVAIYGLIRAGRPRWPVPIPAPVAVPLALIVRGRHIALAGAALAVGAVATSLVPNPLADARRRAVERALVRAESDLVRGASRDLLAVLDPLLPSAALRTPPAAAESA